MKPRPLPEQTTEEAAVALVLELVQPEERETVARVLKIMRDASWLTGFRAHREVVNAELTRDLEVGTRERA